MTPNGDISTGTTPERPVIETAGRDIDHGAAEHVVQGLLEFQNRGDVKAKGRRVARVLEALGRESGAGHSAERPVVVFSFKRAARWVLPIAAAIVLGVSLVYLGIPGEQTALAEMQQTIAAMRTAGERRYEIRMARVGVLSDRPDAIVDSSGDLLLIRHTPPWQRDKTQYSLAGRDSKGPWAIRSGSTIIRGERSEDDWPPYITDGGESFMLASVGVQLDQLPDQFTFTRSGKALIEGSASSMQYDRISAVRKTTAGLMPNRVELWIDPATHQVERIEYRWDAGSVGGGEKSREGGGGPGGMKDGDGPHGPPGPPRDEDGGGPSHGPGGPHGHHDHGPGGSGGPGGPPHGPDGDDDMDGPPPDDHDRGPGHGPHDHDQVDGKGHGGPDGPHGGGPRLIVFQHVNAAPFPAGWFDPETHVGAP